MKSALAFILMAVSLNSYAHFYLGPSARVALFPLTTSAVTSGFTQDISSSADRKAAEMIMRDASDYRQDGTLSVRLAEQIGVVQMSHDVSDEEAVDILMDIAGEILK